MGDDHEGQLNALRDAWREHIEDETPFKIEAAEVLRGILEQVVEHRAEWPDFVKVKRTFLQMG